MDTQSTTPAGAPMSTMESSPAKALRDNTAPFSPRCAPFEKGGQLAPMRHVSVFSTLFHMRAPI